MRFPYWQQIADSLYKAESWHPINHEKVYHAVHKVRWPCITLGSIVKCFFIPLKIVIYTLLFKLIISLLRKSLRLPSLSCWLSERALWRTLLATGDNSIIANFSFSSQHGCNESKQEVLFNTISVTWLELPERNCIPSIQSRPLMNTLGRKMT